MVWGLALGGGVAFVGGVIFVRHRVEPRRPELLKGLRGVENVSCDFELQTERGFAERIQNAQNPEAYVVEPGAQTVVFAQCAIPGFLHMRFALGENAVRGPEVHRNILVRAAGTHEPLEQHGGTKPKKGSGPGAMAGGGFLGFEVPPDMTASSTARLEWFFTTRDIGDDASLPRHSAAIRQQEGQPPRGQGSSGILLPLASIDGEPILASGVIQLQKAAELKHP